MIEFFLIIIAYILTHNMGAISHSVKMEYMYHILFPNLFSGLTDLHHTEGGFCPKLPTS